MRPIGRGRRIGLCSLALVATLGTATLGASCGIGNDSEPRALPGNTSTSTTSTPDPSGTEPSIIHVVQAEKLVPVTRELTEYTPAAVMESVLVPPTPADGRNLSSAIPPQTSLLGIEQEGDLVRIDLSEEFESVVGQVRSQAIGQIVLSQTLVPGVDRLSFSIDGDPLRVQSLDPERGDVDIVADCDFVDLLAEPEAETTDLSEQEMAILALNRDDMKDRCNA